MNYRLFFAHEQARRARAATQRPNLSGEFIDDWATGPKGPTLVLPVAPPVPAAVTGRNMAAEEALAADIIRRNTPPALVAAQSARTRGAPSGAGIATAEPVPALGAEDRVKVVETPWINLPAAGQPFVEMNRALVTLPAIGATVTVVTFTVPRRKNGAIEFIGNQFVGGGWTEGTGDLVWQLLADGVPLQGFDSIIASIGTISSPGNLGRSPFRIFENQVIELTLRNVAVAVAGQPLLGILRGKFYPLEQEGADTWV